MTLTPSDVASVSKSLAYWEEAEYVCAGLVAIACAGEYVADFTNWFTGGIKERKERLAKRSTLLLIFALSLELICLVRTNNLSSRLVGSLSEKAVEADSKAQAALASSASALIQSGTALDKSDQATTSASAIAVRLTNASKQLSAIEHKLLTQGPRWRVLEGKKTTFIESLKPFAGQRIMVVTCGWISGGPEQFKLEWDLIDFLGKEGARWEVKSNSFTRCQNATRGLAIISSSAASAEVKRSVKALHDALANISYSEIHTVPAESDGAAWMGPDSPYVMAAKDPTTVFLLVGANPMIDTAEMYKNTSTTRTSAK